MNAACRDRFEVKATTSNNLRGPEGIRALLKKSPLSKADTAVILHGNAVAALVVMGIKHTDVPDAVEEAQSLAIRLNGETVFVESASRCLDAEVVDQVAVRFAPFIPGVQLGKPASEIALMRGR
jgi:hypothetical protein